MSTNANAIGRKFIFALFHVQSNPAEPWTARAVGNGPGPTPRARQTKGTGARWSRPQGYCLLSRAIIQFPILLYIRPISSQCLLFCVMLPSGGHAGGKRQGAGHTPLSVPRQGTRWGDLWPPAGPEVQRQRICSAQLCGFQFPRPAGEIYAPEPHRYEVSASKKNF